MLAHAREVWPEPACGAVVGSEASPDYLPFTDAEDCSRDAFHLASEALRRFEERWGDVRGIVISHPSDHAAGGPDPLLFTPSAAQMAAQISLGMPFGVVVASREASYRPWWFGDQCPVPGIVGRPFRHGVTDCYSLVRDWFRTERGIVLPDFPRDWNWWLKGDDLYRESFLAAGGRPIEMEEARPGDVILLRVRSDVPNHAVVLLPGSYLAQHFGSLAPYDPRALSHVRRVGRWTRSLATHALRWRGDFAPAASGSQSRLPPVPGTGAATRSLRAAVSPRDQEERPRRGVQDEESDARSVPRCALEFGRQRGIGKPSSLASRA